MNVKNMISSITDGVDSLVAVATSLIVLSVFTGILFGGNVFGVSVIDSIIALIQAFLDAGFTGLLALLVVLSLWK